MRAFEVSDVHGQMTVAQRLAKATVAGKAVLTVRRMRRTPIAAVRARRLREEDVRAGRIPPEDPRRDFRTVYVVPAGPGQRAALEDTIVSIKRYEGDTAKIVVCDDCTVDCREAVVRDAHPDVTVLRPRYPAGSDLRLAPVLTRAYAYALDHYDFDVLCKIDTDALVTGPGLGERAAAAFAEDPTIGALGTCRTRADGSPEDYSYDRWVVEHERRWSRNVRRMVDAATASGYDGSKVHGGVYLLSRRALEAARAAGRLPWSPPWWTLMGEDTAISLIVWASGFRTASWGGPGDPTASGQGYLPVEKEDVVENGILAVHSVRRGLRGESEPELRSFFRAAREAA